MKNKRLYVSAGLVIIQNNKILLAHPTNSPTNGSYTFPKGKVEIGESILEAAIRETKEETGILINKKDINNTEHLIIYTNKNGDVYKKLYYFLVFPTEKIEINKNNIQLDEVDWVGFLNKDEIMTKIFWRFSELLQYLK